MYKHSFVTRRSAVKFGCGMLAAAVGAVATSKLIDINYPIQAQENSDREFPVSGEASLKERAAAKGLIYGAAIQYSQLSSDQELANQVKRECRMLVPEWELKWSVGGEPLRPSPDNFNFSRADWMVNFAKTNGLFLRGHTLVWHESLPPWFKSSVNSKNAQDFLEKHIKSVVGRYSGKIHSWDVVNEAIYPSDNRHDGLRGTPWLELLGTDYIDLAFRLAAEYDPQALLVYNDFDLDYDTPNDEAKRIAVLKLLESLKSKETPIHALGIQAHLLPGNHKFNAEKLRQFLADVASLGLKIMITEMDVADKYLPVDIATRDRIIAAAYEDYLSTALDERAVIAVITWGLSDRYTWLSEFKPRDDQASVRPLPFDQQMQPKLAWNAIARAFDNAPQR